MDRVQKCQARGMDLDSIVALLNEDKALIVRIIEDEELAVRRAREVLAERTPHIESAFSLGLGVINDVMKKLATDEVYRDEMLSRMSDVGTLARVISDLNILLRLERNQSTANIAQQVNYQDTRKVLQELQEKDPVFDYGNLKKDEPGA